jgi:16S rRNA (uracil1498-N3)-methyltransferase
LPYFFAGRRDGDRVSILGADARHLAGPLRARPGELVEVIDAGAGELLTVRVEAVARDVVEGRIESTRPHRPEPATRVTMCLALLPATALEVSLERCTELGADRFVLVAAERSVARGSKPERWATICREAAMLAGRLHIPSVEGPVEAPPVEAIFLDRDAGVRLAATVAQGTRKVTLAIGPEGGWTPRELAAAATTASLGPRNLRAENAAAAALAVALAATGDL